MSLPKGHETQKLHRVLSLRDLIFYGIVAVTPSAPATVFGLAESKSHGHVVVTILAAMVAMVLTAISYGRMAALYPSAGSAYTYVGRGLHPYLGFVAGWAMLLDYVFIPAVLRDLRNAVAAARVSRLPFPVGRAAVCRRHHVSEPARHPLHRARQPGPAGLHVRRAHRLHRARDSLPRRFIMASWDCFPSSRSTIREPSTSRDIAWPLRLPRSPTWVSTPSPRWPKTSKIRAATCCSPLSPSALFTGLFGGLLVYLAHLAWPDYSHLHQCRNRVHRRHRARRRLCAVPGHGDPSGGRQHRRRPDLAGRGRASALRHGKRRRHSAPLLRPPSPRAQHA